MTVISKCVLLVEFKKLLGKKEFKKPIDPINIFENLDKDSDRPYLRPPQIPILEDWFNNHREKRDILIKLPTGQGKTLIGFLILQSFLNEKKGPAIYVCPNNYLVDQILKEAKSFGIKAIKFDNSRPPQRFLNSEAILVANCSKVFNGRSVFGVKGSRREYVNIGAFVMDDAHKCLDIIKQQYSVIIDRKSSGKENPLYAELWNLFKDSLDGQAAGTCLDIEEGRNSILAVPFWTWFSRSNEVLQILSKYREEKELLFVWDFIKDHIEDSLCIFSGEKIEITPRLIPIDSIPSYNEADKRIFLSATLKEDDFLVRDMGVDLDSVSNPITTKDIKDFGERFILIPSLVDTNIQRKEIISWIQEIASKNGDFGVVAITPSFNHADSWVSGGAEITRVTTLYESIDELKNKVDKNLAKNVVILVNEYDGVDLPDNTCRILVLDSLPSYIPLMDRYLYEVRSSSGIIQRKLSQRVEQGMGRAIRGASDWCVVIIAGNDLTNYFSNTSKRKHLSNVAQRQINIGEELAEVMKKLEGEKIKVIEELVKQCLNRDEGWKEYYKESMSKIEPDELVLENLNRALTEKEAEILFRQRQHRRAAKTVLDLLDDVEQNDQGWYLQLAATYLFPVDRRESMDKQLAAHSNNPSLFRPLEGVTYSKLTSTGTRASKILDWVKNHGSYNSAIIEVNNISGKLLFGGPSNTFEEGIAELGTILGFVTDRPEQKLGKGPDDLWNIQGSMYWIIECKNQVESSREEISKREIAQLNQAINWFKEEFPVETYHPIMIYPTEKLSDLAYPGEACWCMTKDNLYKLVENTKEFYSSLTGTPFEGLSGDNITQKLAEYKLDTDSLIGEYLTRIRKQKDL